MAGDKGERGQGGMRYMKRFEYKHYKYFSYKFALLGERGLEGPPGRIGEMCYLYS